MPCISSGLCVKAIAIFFKNLKSLIIETCCNGFNFSPSMHGKYADTKLDYVLYVKIYNIGRQKDLYYFFSFVNELLIFLNDLYFWQHFLFFYKLMKTSRKYTV